MESNTKSLWGDISGWSNVLNKFGVDFYITVDIEGIEPNWNDSNIESYHVNTFQEALDKLQEVHSECETVWLKSDNSIELKDFTHPINACYIFGADNANTVFDTADHNVKLYIIDIWAINCASIVLYNRFVSGVDQ